MTRQPRAPSSRDWTIYRLCLQKKRSFTLSEVVDQVLELAVANGRKATLQAKCCIWKIVRRRLVYKKGSCHKLRLSQAFVDAVKEVSRQSNRFTVIRLRTQKALVKLQVYQSPTHEIQQQERDAAVRESEELARQLEEVTEERDIPMKVCDELRAEITRVPNLQPDSTGAAFLDDLIQTFEDIRRRMDVFASQQNARDRAQLQRESGLQQQLEDSQRQCLQREAELKKHKEDTQRREGEHRKAVQRPLANA